MSNTRQRTANIPLRGVDDKDSKTVRTSTESIVSQRMAIAGVFFDVALFVADVEHLKFVLDSGKEVIGNYHLLLSLLIASLSIQLVVGILLFVSGFNKLQPEEGEEQKSEAKWQTIVDNIIVGLVSVIALINILVTVFGDRTESLANFCSVYNCTK